MILKIKNGIIFDENDIPMGSLSNEAPEIVEQTIELGSEAIPAIKNFISQVNSGKFKPRTIVKEFELLLSKYKI